MPGGVSLSLTPSKREYSAISAGRRRGAHAHPRPPWPGGPRPATSLGRHAPGHATLRRVTQRPRSGSAPRQAGPARAGHPQPSPGHDRVGRGLPDRSHGPCLPTACCGPTRRHAWATQRLAAGGTAAPGVAGTRRALHPVRLSASDRHGARAGCGRQQPPQRLGQGRGRRAAAAMARRTEPVREPMPHRPRRALAAIDPCRTDPRGGQVAAGYRPRTPRLAIMRQHRPGPQASTFRPCVAPGHTECAFRARMSWSPSPARCDFGTCPAATEALRPQACPGLSPGPPRPALAPRCVRRHDRAGWGLASLDARPHDPPTWAFRRPAGGRASDGRQWRPSRHMVLACHGAGRLCGPTCAMQGARPRLCPCPPHLWAQAGGCW